MYIDMIQQYVEKFIENLPEELKNNKNPIKLDLVLDGGVFNGSYLVGALYFLKEMEKRNYIKICRISGCSIGSIGAFLYIIDCLDISESFYSIIFEQLKNQHNLNISKVLNSILENKIPDDICSKVNNKLYIKYTNIKKIKRKTKYIYKNKEDIINTIIKSSYIPFFMDGNLLFENKYIDGINPYVFKIRNDRKILYLDLFGYDKIKYLINVKNEKSNFHRILSGVLDIHNFFIKKSNTDMCSYVNKWSLFNKTRNFLKMFIEKIFIYFIYLVFLIKKCTPLNLKDYVLYKILSKIIYETYIILLRYYCI
jgi:hypothetical protein